MRGSKPRWHNGRYSLTSPRTQLGRVYPAFVTSQVTIGKTPFKLMTATLIRTYHVYNLDPVTECAFLISLSPMWSINPQMADGPIAK